MTPYNIKRQFWEFCAINHFMKCKLNLWYNKLCNISRFSSSDQWQCKFEHDRILQGNKYPILNIQKYPKNNNNFHVMHFDDQIQINNIRFFQQKKHGVYWENKYLIKVRHKCTYSIFFYRCHTKCFINIECFSVIFY